MKIYNRQLVVLFVVITSLLANIFCSQGNRQKQENANQKSTVNYLDSLNKEFQQIYDNGYLPGFAAFPA